MIEFKDKISADVCVSNDMKVFADYTVATKLPHYLDGLKVVARRILIVLHKMHGLPKELSVGGEVVKMHPHGDASINTAISVMAQPFSHIVPLVFSESNIGTYDGDKPAGARYVDVGESELAKAIFFDDANPNMYDMVPCETEDNVEPAYLIPRIPTSLMVQNFAIVVGFQTNTPGLAIPELCKLTKEYIAIRASEVKWQEKARKTLYKYLLPDFPIACSIRNSKELLEAYKNGDYNRPVLIEGTMHVDKEKIIVHTLPPVPGLDFRTTTFSVGQTAAKVKNSWEAQNFQQMEGFAGKEQKMMSGNFKCVVRRGMNPFDVLATLKKKLQYACYFRPIRNFTDSDGNLRTETPFTLLDAWYDTRYNAVLGDLKQTLNNLVDRQRQLLALIIVRDHSEEVFKIFNNAKEDTIIPALVKRFGLTRYQAKFVGSLKFSQITAKGKDELLNELEDVKRKMEDLQNKFHHVPEIMIESVEKFEKEFVDKISTQGDLSFDLRRRCIVPKYIGAAIYRGTGHILIEDESEFDHILKDFDPEDLDFKLFYPRGTLRTLGSDEDIEEGQDLPKYLKSMFVDRVPEVHYTGCQLAKGAMVVRGVVPQQEHMKFAIPLEKTFIVIEKNGSIHKETISEKILRKSISAGATMKDAVHISNGDDDVIVIHGNSSQTNLVVIERVNLANGAAKLRKVPVGSWYILNVVSPGTRRVYLNLPKEIRQRCGTRHIVIDNLSDCINVGQRLNLVFGRTTTKSDFELKPIRKKSTILIASRI